jgi:hypothetical protein
MNETPELPQISLVYDQGINYAFQQNAIPVIKELRFCNDVTVRKNLIIRIVAGACRSFGVQGCDCRVIPLSAVKLSSSEWGLPLEA